MNLYILTSHLGRGKSKISGQPPVQRVMSSSSVDHRRLARPSLLDTRLSMGSLLVALTLCSIAAWICHYAPELWNDLGRIALLMGMLIGFAFLVLVVSLLFILTCVGTVALFAIGVHRASQLVLR